MYYVYVLKSKITENWTYIGFSSDLKKRFESHNEGKNQSTKSFKPFNLVFYEAFRNKEDALRREIYLKSAKGRRVLKLMLQNEIW